MKNRKKNDELVEAIAESLRITKTTRRAAAAGTWVCGTIHGHRFEALVFPEHADNPDYEIGDSRISKLCVQRISDRVTVYNWDRGADVSPADDVAAAIVDFLCAGLAETTYSAPCEPELNPTASDELLSAARAILAAHDNQMVTVAEWRRLRRAIERAPNN